MDSVDFDVLEDEARARLPESAFAVLATGADVEIDALENISAWRGLRMRPHVLNDVTAIDTSVSMVGAQMTHAIMVASMGRHKLFHPDGERATARGAVAGAA